MSIMQSNSTYFSEMRVWLLLSFVKQEYKITCQFFKKMGRGGNERYIFISIGKLYAVV